MNHKFALTIAATIAAFAMAVQPALAEIMSLNYLGESAANVSAKAARRGLSIEDYLKTIALELKQEIWEREPGAKGKWLKQSNQGDYLRVQELG